MLTTRTCNRLWLLERGYLSLVVLAVLAALTSGCGRTPLGRPQMDGAEISGPDSSGQGIDSSGDEGVCLVDFVTYQSGTANPNNPCQSCQPSRSKTGWSSLATGTGCLGLGFDQSCAIINGSAWCWGGNTYGQLGNNSTTSRASAVPVQGLASEVQAIVGANGNSYALVNGGVQAWGDNSQGELGNNSTTNGLVPVPVQGLSSGIQTVVAGWYHACALASGEVWCWGDNNYGQLGNTGGQSDVPVLVQGLPSGVQAIAAGDNHTCVLVADDVWCWGLNADAQLGHASSDYGDLINPYNPNPVKVAGVPSGMGIVAAGGSLSCVLADGKVWCWGKTDHLSGPAASAVPAMVSGLPSLVRAVAVGGKHACALLDDGIMCWGRDDAGQLGDNSPSALFASLPVRVQGLPSPVQAVAAGWYHTCAWAASAVWCWGYNFSGELGNNSTSLSSVPVRVLGLPGS